jgi:8-oxo-dGTP diphosphatase
VPSGEDATVNRPTSTPSHTAAVQLARETDLVCLTAESAARRLSLHIFEVPFDLPLLEIGMARHRRNDADAAHQWLRAASRRRRRTRRGRLPVADQSLVDVRICSRRGGWVCEDRVVESSDSPLRGPFVGTSAVVVRGGLVLLGRRLGAHGAGEWSFPGGKVDAGEPPAAAAARELAEETGLVATSVTPIGWTNDVFAAEGLHFVTLHHLVEATGEPEVLEPDKVEGWSWHAWDALPDPLFAPIRSLVADGWRPSTGIA